MSNEYPYPFVAPSPFTIAEVQRGKHEHEKSIRSDAYSNGWEQGFSDCLAFFGSEPTAHELERALVFFGRVSGETK